jgi:peptide/nickel transport system ATP-binding protein
LENLLEVNKLQTVFHTDKGMVTSVDEVSFSLKAGETVCIVGESGCGKSVTSLSIMRLLGKSGSIHGGSILYKQTDLVQVSDAEMRRIRGNEITMIFQEPMTSLNPVFKIGVQIMEVIVLHLKLSKKEARRYAVEMLNQVGIPRAEEIMQEYPHALSGGMRQRVMIAMALACKPSLLIADEPTTALDVTIQAQILKLMKQLRERSGTAIMLITHDLGVVAEMADQVIVMYAGQVVEQADVFTLFDNPKHPYTKGLLQAIPHLDHDADQRLYSIPGTVPALQQMPSGCRFNTRCASASSRCFAEEPPLTAIQGQAEHLVKCWQLEPVEVREKVSAEVHR